MIMWTLKTGVMFAEILLPITEKKIILNKGKKNKTYWHHTFEQWHIYSINNTYWLLVFYKFFCVSLLFVFILIFFLFLKKIIIFLGLSACCSVGFAVLYCGENQSREGMEWLSVRTKCPSSGLEQPIHESRPDTSETYWPAGLGFFQKST